MALTLNLGVLDVAYSGDKSAQTTGGVAQILEDRYHVMEIFFELHREKIANLLADGMAIQIADLMSGKRPNRDPFAGVMAKVEKEFRAFLTSDEVQKIMPPEQRVAAAQMGVSHRFLNPNGKPLSGKALLEAAQSGALGRKAKKETRKERPAFIDTGLFRASFRAWVSGNIDAG